MPIGLILAVGGVLVSPILWFLISWICTKIPFAANFLSKMFWELLGEIPVFKAAAKILEQVLSYEEPSVSYFFLSYLEMVFSSVLDAFIMGFSVFVFKALFARVSRQGLITIPRVRMATVLGVAVGVLLTMGKGVLPDMFEGVFQFLICAGCMLLGIGLLLRRPVRAHHSATRNAGIAGFLMQILIDANIAICCVSIATCTMEGPRIVQETGSAKMWFAWYGMSVLMYFLLDSVIFFMSPSLRNSL